MATITAINEMGNFAHNPRGNLWFNDNSSYGHQLMLKMGWSKGKGLGKQENGIKENLKVKFRNTNSGLGFKDDSYANVMKTEYDSILRSLSAEYRQKNSSNENSGPKKLNQKSKTVKCRIRYPKLYYGKDVSKYSEKDMKSIFICSLPSKENEEEKSKSPESLHKTETKNQPSSLYETHNSQLSISDYFNLKMKEKMDNKLKKQESISENKQKNIDFECNITKNTMTSVESADIENNKNENAVLIFSKKKNKKNKKNSKLLFTNSDSKSLVSVENGKEQDLTTVNVEPLELKKSLGKDDIYEKVGELSSSSSNQSSLSNRKRKRSHKKENLDSSESINSSSLNFETVSDSLPMPNKKKKKLYKNIDNNSVDSIELLSICSKEKVLENSEIVNISGSSSVQVTNTSSTGNNNNEITKRNKKLKRKLHKLKKLKSCLRIKRDSYVVRNVSFNENVSYRIIDSDKEYTDAILNSQEVSQNDFVTSSDNNCKLEMNSNDGDCEVLCSSFSERNGNNNLKEESENEETVESNDTEDCDFKSSLPASNSNYYNSWIESQMQAMKMKMYKELLKNVKKHDILKTTNLLSIKGYGNWGFKK